jgi:hypothetical protein
MCDCVNVGFGTYDNVVTLITPEGKSVDIDRCIAEEIKYLWSLGIETMASCCGHNKIKGSVIVAKKDIEFIKKLGYKTLPLKDSNGRYRDDNFETKTHRNKEGKLIYRWYEKDD